MAGTAGGTGNVTMRDVAEAAGVSTKTVSNVVNGYPYIRAETRERVEAALAALGYRMNVSARNLRQGRTGMIALVVPELRAPYFAELADSVISAADAHGLRVLIEQTGGAREREVEVLSGALRHLVDGVIFSPLALHTGDRERFGVDFPLVLLGESVFGSAADHVTMSNVEGATAATAHLLGLGRRRVAAIGVGHEGRPGSATLRLEGYRAALAEAGLPVLPELEVATTGWHRAGGEQAVLGLLDRGTPFDAVVAFNDALAHGVLHALHRRRVAVPEDVAVVGFDDTEESSYSTPTLTSVEPGRAQIAQAAVELLVRRAEEGRTGDARRAELVVAPFTLQVRESTVGG
jgi:DNA-binding LacI/PurR family transcriptional regulator